MLSMNKLLFVHTLFICVFAGDYTWTNLRVKFEPPEVGKYGIPMTVDQAEEEGYVKAATHEDFSKIDIYCLHNDPRGCPMYDTYGKLCGFRAGYVIGTLSDKCEIDSYYHYETIAMFKKGWIFGDIDYYHVDCIFSTPACLLAGGPTTRTAPLGDSLHVKLDGKTWTEIPKKEENILNIPGMVKQACYPQMGQHYFFIGKNTNCADAKPFFALYHKRWLIGMGMFGMGSVSEYKRDWYENIPPGFIKITFTTPPECLAPAIEKCGGISMHMYFTEKPQNITCP
ncbi:uncharacterized protein LOC128996932 [Macrosteles quadrilineatus]|uniref:uncharacterized protein LOC128996932 n=1 Tax=Macrosteles quadrilineatus TaxID=74068 RepID=UPI0023E2C751|nr:uncharacterized protein LOC128996932 [Macrosteles quadrilineatus]